VNVDYEADKDSYSLAVKVENWCKVEERFVSCTLLYLHHIQRETKYG